MMDAMEEFENYYKRADLNKDGKIEGLEAASFFQDFGLPKQILAQIWTFVDSERRGYLDRTEFYNALKLVSVAQTGRELTPDIVKSALYGPDSPIIPAPKLSSAQSERSTVIDGSEVSSEPSGRVWPEFQISDIEKYRGIFEKVDKDCNGKISVERARYLFLTWKVPEDVADQVLELSDINNDGVLSLREFCIAVYLLERQREKHTLPKFLPDELRYSETLIQATGLPSSTHVGPTWHTNAGLSDQIHGSIDIPYKEMKHQIQTNLHSQISRDFDLSAHNNSSCRSFDFGENDRVQSFHGEKQMPLIQVQVNYNIVTAPAGPATLNPSETEMKLQHQLEMEIKIPNKLETEDPELAMAIKASIESAIAEGVHIGNSTIGLTVPDLASTSQSGYYQGLIYDPSPGSTSVAFSPFPMNQVYPSPPVPTIPSAPFQTLNQGPIHYPSIDLSPVDIGISETEKTIKDEISNSTSEIKEGNNGNDSKLGTCIICYENRVECACIPCGHMAGCMECLKEIQTNKMGCPICRAEIEKVTKLYAV